MFRQSPPKIINYKATLIKLHKSEIESISLEIITPLNYDQTTRNTYIKLNNLYYLKRGSWSDIELSIDGDDEYIVSRNKKLCSTYTFGFKDGIDNPPTIYPLIYSSLLKRVKWNNQLDTEQVTELSYCLEEHALQHTYQNLV